MSTEGGGPSKGMIGGLALKIILVAAVVAIVLVVLGVMGIAVPSWVMMILWIAGAAIFAAFVIKLLMSMF